MAWGVRWYPVGSIVLGLLGVLAGCSGGGFFAERAPWRHEAEVQCLNAGAVKEGAGIVRIRPIRGPRAARCARGRGGRLSAEGVALGRARAAGLRRRAAPPRRHPTRFGAAALADQTDRAAALPVARAAGLSGGLAAAAA